jgi:DNA-binding NarL/FixJ family response regulator
VRLEKQGGVAPIRVGVAEANVMACGLVSAGLKRYSRFDVVGSTTSIAGLFRMISTGNPEVIVIGCDLEDGKLTGLSVLSEIKRAHPEIHVVLLIDRSDPKLVVQAFQAGVKGILDRSECHFARLCKCVVCVHQGQIWANTQQLKFILEAVAQAPAPRVVDADGANLLTKREEDLVRLVVDGLGNREIAKRLNLSEHTVKNYMFRIFTKLGISNRVELVLYALNPRPTSMSILDNESLDVELESNDPGNVQVLPDV